MKNRFMKMMKTKVTHTLFLAVFILFCMAWLFTAAQQAAAQNLTMSDGEGIDKFNMSQSWTNDAYFDYTTLKRNNDLGRDTKLVATQKFGTKYTVRFVLSVDKEAWDGTPKTMFRIALDAADDNNTDSGKQIWFKEHIITVDGGMAITPTEYGGSQNLWQQTYKDGSGFGTYPDVNGFYEFMLDVDGNTLDLYIERKIDLPFTQPRYKITTETNFEGNLAFLSCDSAYQFRIGGVTVDYQDEKGNATQFKGLFNVGGSIGDFNETNCLWHSNLVSYNTQSEEAYYVKPNSQITSNFNLSGLKGTLKYEISGISNHNLWNNNNAGIRIIAGITNDNSEGYVLASLCNNYFNIGNSTYDFSLNDEIQGGLRSPSTSFKIKIELYQSFFRVYISALLDGEYTKYYHIHESHPTLLGDIPYTELQEGAIEDIANGKIALRSFYNEEEENPVSFSVKALAIEEYVDLSFKVDAEVIAVKSAIKGEYFYDIPEIPDRDGYIGAWELDFSSTKFVKDMTINAIYSIKTFDVVFNADGKNIKTLKVDYGGDVLKDDIPIIPLKEGYTQTSPYWDKSDSDLKNIKVNIIVNAIYTLNKYKVTTPEQNNFIFKSTDLDIIEHGGRYSFTITPAEAYDKSSVNVKVNGMKVSPVLQIYTINDITSDVSITVDALSINTYSVTFKADGTTIKTITVSHGGDIVSGDFPAIPEKNGYTAAWKDIKLTGINADTVIEAVYTEKTAEPKTDDKGCGCSSVTAIDVVSFSFIFIVTASLICFLRKNRKYK